MLCAKNFLSQDTTSVSRLKIRKETCTPFLGKYKAVLNDSANIYEVKKSTFINKSKLLAFSEVGLPDVCSDSIFELECRFFESSLQMQVMHISGPVFTKEFKDKVNSMSGSSEAGLSSVFILVRVATAENEKKYRAWSFNFVLTSK